MSAHPEKNSNLQVSFGVFETEEEASQQYDRALVVEKGRSGSLIG